MMSCFSLSVRAAAGDVSPVGMGHMPFHAPSAASVSLVGAVAGGCTVGGCGAGAVAGVGAVVGAVAGAVAGVGAAAAGAGAACGGTCGGGCAPVGPLAGKPRSASALRCCALVGRLVPARWSAVAAGYCG